jgi:hypothetical protein
MGLRLWRDEISPEDFFSVGEIGFAPMARDLAGPAFDRMLEGFLRMGTVLVEAWPLSVMVALLVLMNAWGGLLAMARSEKGRFTVLRVMAAAIVIVAALWHLGEVALRVVPGIFGWAPLWLGVVLARGGGVFPMMTGFGLLMWVFWWMGKVEAGWKKAPPRSRDALRRAGTLVLFPVIYWGAMEGWRVYGEDWGLLSRNVWLLAAIGASWLFVVALVLYMTGKDRMRVCLVQGQLVWWAGNWERFIWWGLMAALHLFLVEACGISAEAVLDSETVAGFAWAIFFPFLRGAVTVWLLGALVGLVLVKDGKG